MQATRRLFQYQPLIKFVGRRHAIPQNIDHAPHVHPASPAESLPKSFAQYREEAIQHGPLKGARAQAPQSSASPNMNTSTVRSTAPSQQHEAEHPYGAIGGKSAKELGPIRPGKGEFMDRNELPTRFHRMAWSQAEIDAIESGGASMYA